MIRWTSGAAHATTTIEYTAAGGSPTTIAGIAAGTTSRTINGLTHSTTYDVRAKHVRDGQSSTWAGPIQFTTPEPTPTLTPPSGLNVTALTYNSATIRWTNGTPSATTRLEYRKTTTTTWTSLSVSAGATSQGLTGLSAVTGYYVRIRHQTAGAISAWTSNLFFKTPAPPAPTVTNFRVAACREVPSGGSTLIEYTLAWDAAPAQADGSYEIAMHTLNNAGAATIVTTVSGSIEQAIVGGFLKSATTSNRYFWVRYIRGAAPTSWVALSPNPVPVNRCFNP